MRRITLALILLVLVTTRVSTAFADDRVPVLDRSRAVVIEGVIMGSNILQLIPRLQKLASEDSSKPIDIVISSPGGQVETGFLFINALEEIRAGGTPIRCYVPTLAASMAFQILLHCDERYTLDYSWLLWHGVRVGTGMGAVITSKAAQELADSLRLVDVMILSDLYDTLGISLDHDQIDYHFDKETLHAGKSLAKLAPGFIRSYKSIPGLMEILSDKTVPRNNGATDKLHAGTVYYIYTGE